MRVLGTARRGDVVFLQNDNLGCPPAEIRADELEVLEALHQESGVRCIMLGPAMRPAGLAPHRRVTARRGPTPRWARR